MRTRRASVVLVLLGLAITALQPRRAAAWESLGTGNGALVGDDLTEPENSPTFTASDDVPLAPAAFDNAVTGAGATWCCTGPNPAVWVAVELAAPAVLRSFTLARGPAVEGFDSGFNDSFDAEENADVWRLQGSNGGSAWNDIYVWNREGLSPFTDASQVIVFRSGSGPGADYPVPPAYSHFRYLVESVVDEISNNHQLAELELFDTVLGGAPAAWYVAPPPLGASDNTCTSAAEPCNTLQLAVDKAAAGDVVILAAGIYTATTTIAKTLEIVGAGADATDLVGTDGEPALWVSGSDVRLRDLVIHAESESAGAIVHSAGDLLVADCDLSGNSGTEAGAVHSFGHSLRVSRTRFDDNHSFVDAGGIRLSSGRLYVGQSLFRANRASLGAAILVGPFIGGEPQTQGWISASTFVANESDDGSVITAGLDARLAVFSSTVAGNVALLPPGSTLRGAVSNYADVSVVALRGVLLAEQTSHCFREDTGLITNLITSYGYNFAEGASCPWLFEPSDHTGAVLAKLGPLGDHGGPLATRAPFPSSGARDTGLCRSSLDARGFVRPIDLPPPYAAGGDGCDIGAVEASLLPPFGLVAFPTGGHVDLFWNDISGDEVFEIERTPGPAPPGTTGGATITSDTTVICETGYSYRVRAVRTVGVVTDFSDWSNSAAVTTGSCQLFRSGFEVGDATWSSGPIL